MDYNGCRTGLDVVARRESPCHVTGEARPVDVEHSSTCRSINCPPSIRGRSTGASAVYEEAEFHVYRGRGSRVDPSSIISRVPILECDCPDGHLATASSRNLNYSSLLWQGKEERSDN